MIEGEIKRFWTALYDAAHKDIDARLTPEGLQTFLGELKRLFRHRRHLAAVEMPLDSLSGKRVLEVGSGAGAHAAFFSSLGAEVIALDLAWDRILATSRKLTMTWGSPKSICVHADARCLPYVDGVFDIVYSNGVLHHSPNIELAIHEIHRVLKPGGKSIVMLYARDSFLYRGVLFPIRGILQGGILRDRQWLGRATERFGARKQRVNNPWTEVFSVGEVRSLFREFTTVTVRKNSFVFDQIPVIGRVLSRIAGFWTGWNPAGFLLYGNPWRNETRFELWAGQYVGFGLNISAVK